MGERRVEEASVAESRVYVVAGRSPLQTGVRILDLVAASCA
jgi:hypothetical protein